MFQEVRDILYVDSQGREAYASEPLGSVVSGDLVMFTYRKRLKTGSKVDDGVAYLCVPNHCLMRKDVMPADTEDEAKCNLLAALSVEIGMTEHHLEFLRKCKDELSDELR